MSQIVKAVQALTKASTAAEWAALEAQILPSQLKVDEISDIAVHYGRNKQGSYEFWSQIHEQSANRIAEFDPNQLGKLVYGMMSHKHEVDEKYGEIITERMEQVYEEMLPEVEAKHPNWLQDTTRQFSKIFQVPFIQTLIQVYKEKVLTQNQHPVYENQRRENEESEDEEEDNEPTPEWAIDIIQDIQNEYVHSNIDQKKVREFVEKKVEEMESLVNQLK